MRPSKIAGADAAGLRRQRIACAGHAQHRSRHRIVDAAAMRVGDRQPVGIDRRLRLDGEFLDVAVGQHHADGFGLLRRRGGSGIIGRAPARRRRRGPATRRCRSRRKRPSAGRRCRRRRRRKTDRPIFRCSSRPCRRECRTASPHSAPPAAPAPGRNPARQHERQHHGQPHSPPSARSGNPAGRGEIMRGMVTEGRSSTRRVGMYHLGQNIRQTMRRRPEPLMSAANTPFI